MDLVGISIKKPVTIIVGIIFVVLFGIIGLERMPYQLSPTVVKPVITVTTTWRGATPYEIEREITERQEEKLKGIPGLYELESTSQDGQAAVTLTFRLGTDVDNALLRVSNKINEVVGYPLDADKPVITATGAATSPVIWMALETLKGNQRDVDTYYTYFDNDIRQYLERVEGVADLFIGGGRAREMHVIVDPNKLAAYGITMSNLVRVLDSENVNVSSGDLNLGRRDYRIRTTGEFQNPEDIENVVIRSTGQRRVYVRDVAHVEFGYQKKVAVVIHNGNGAMAIGIKPEPGTNILDLTNRMEKVVNWLNSTKLKEQGVKIHWIYDQRFYINSAISLIKQNILIGGLLAIFVLLTFLRSFRATLVVGLAIPISVIGTFIFLWLLGRNLNVVSMAGIAFAVGMLVDNAIVVMENIDRHRMMGKSAFRAAYDGTSEVWGAVLASTATTVAVFLPVVFVQEEAGQLFRDIAIAVAASVTLSLIVSVSVIPMLANLLLSHGSKKKKVALAELIGTIGTRISNFFMDIVGLAIRSTGTRIATVVLLTGFATLTFFVLVPDQAYLPQGNRNFVFAALVPPPGLSLDEAENIGKTFFAAASPHLGHDVGGIPAIKNMFYVGSNAFMFAGAMTKDWSRAKEIIPMLNRTINTIPGIIGMARQAGIFQTRIGGSNTVNVDISGNDIDRIAGASAMMFVKLMQAIPGQIPRPNPSFQLQYPEVNLVPNRDRLRANNLSSSDLGVALDVMLDGRKIGDFKEAGKKKIDLMLMGPQKDATTPEELYHDPVVTPGGKIVPVSSLSTLKRSYGITQIRHLERNRTITLEVTPPEGMPIQTAMRTIEKKVVDPMKKSGILSGLNVSMSGAASQLVETSRALKWNFVLAALIAYLLMAALFENFIYPFIIMFTVPLASAGGILGLQILNLFLRLFHQPPQLLDILTMLGFIILIGVVVNNAILIVHQSLNNVRDYGMEHREAVLESVRSRIRPIYMSATTSVFGMLPLVIFPGAGSELYRGLGSVMLGGLAVSTIFTVFIIPSLLMFVIKMEKPGSRSEEEKI